jgi:hypothetical protein
MQHFHGWITYNPKYRNAVSYCTNLDVYWANNLCIPYIVHPLCHISMGNNYQSRPRKTIYDTTTTIKNIGNVEYLGHTEPYEVYHGFLCWEYIML